jgi:cytochrome c oxidase assembly factor CtaG
MMMIMVMVAVSMMMILFTTSDAATTTRSAAWILGSHQAATTRSGTIRASSQRLLGFHSANHAFPSSGGTIYQKTKENLLFANKQ